MKFIKLLVKKILSSNETEYDTEPEYADYINLEELISLSAGDNCAGKFEMRTKNYYYECLCRGFDLDEFDDFLLNMDPIFEIEIIACHYSKVNI